MPVTRVAFPNLRGQTLVGILDTPDAPTGGRPAMVLCHGFTGFKEVKYLVRLAQGLSRAGFVCLRFDYADGVGDSDGGSEDMLLTHQIEDTHAALNFLETDPDVDARRIGLAGHSLGGVACIAVAAADTRVKALMTIAAPAHPDWQRLFDPAMVERWERDGVADIPMYPRGHARVRYGFLPDFQRYDAAELVRNVRAPALFIQGARDDVVPPRNARALRQRGRPEADRACARRDAPLSEQREPPVPGARRRGVVQPMPGRRQWAVARLRRGASSALVQKHVGQRLGSERMHPTGVLPWKDSITRRRTSGVIIIGVSRSQSRDGFAQAAQS